MSGFFFNASYICMRFIQTEKYTEQVQIIVGSIISENFTKIE